MFKYYNHTLLHSKRTYTLKKFCAVFKDKKMHPQTVRGWINSGDLKIISKNPIVIQGSDGKEFLKKRNESHRRKPEFNQIKCTSCKNLLPPKNREVTIYRNKNGSWNAKGICESCGNEIFRFYGQDDLDKLQQIFVVKQPELMTLCNRLDAPSKTHLKGDDKLVSNESQNNKPRDPPNTNSKTNEPKQLSLL